MKIVFLITFFVFFAEAFLHYNIGKNKGKAIHAPTMPELFKIAAIVGVFSYINAVLINYLDD